MIVLPIEGADGTGKSSLVRRIAQGLCDAGIAARAWHHRVESDDPVRRVFDFMAQRREVTRHAGAPWAPEVLVTDRWWLSTVVDAALANNKSVALLALAEVHATWLPPTPLWVVLDAPDAILDARLTARGEVVTEADRARRAAYRNARNVLGETRAAVGDVRHFDTDAPAEVTAERVVSNVLPMLRAHLDTRAETPAQKETP